MSGTGSRGQLGSTPYRKLPRGLATGFANNYSVLSYAWVAGPTSLTVRTGCSSCNRDDNSKPQVAFSLTPSTALDRQRLSMNIDETQQARAT